MTSLKSREHTKSFNAFFAFLRVDPVIPLPTNYAVALLAWVALLVFNSIVVVASVGVAEARPGVVAANAIRGTGFALRFLGDKAVHALMQRALVCNLFTIFY